MSVDDRVAVKTYVPQYQKQEWERDASAMEMSTSEFVRTMVQAGRSDIILGTHREQPSNAESDGSSDTDVATTPVSNHPNEFKHRVQDVLRRYDVLDWDELVDALVDDVEDDLDDALQELQAENAVMYSGRSGGYTLIDDE
ncbi:DUF5805 domain-containing protein [Halovivax gelatinilyticus]|uniref:DUF5805 domain-containing protein n=1 Tax=Halovivax gelatinilyticus TaxID=2961597 RepID=UPI0020CA998C|nr:DUF5805 domain-containing protein [Halovivax gelatinilyticus]